MFDFKYHIVSLVAVFLALGIGVVMGSMSAERGVITEQERALIATMEKDFDRLRASNDDLNKQLSVAAKFEAGATAMLNSGKLVDKNVAVIITGDIGADTLKTLKGTLEQAGAIQLSVTTFSGKLGLDDKTAMAKVASVVGDNPEGQTEIRERALEETARWITGGINPQGISALAEAGFLKMSGDYDKPVQAVIIIGGLVNGKNLPPDQVDAHIIKTLQLLPVTIAGVESTSVKKSYMNAYQDMGISTVDDIDSPPGQISVVYVLAGLSGDYGEKATANAPMPEPSKSR